MHIHIYALTHVYTETLMSTCIHTETLKHVYIPIYKHMYIYTDICHVCTDI